MADIEKKLNMSLDDLAKQGNRQHHRSQGGRGQGGQQQWGQQGRRPYQQQQGGWVGGNRPYHNNHGSMQYGQQQQWGQQQQMHPQQQQQWGAGGPQRRDGKQSVFARLSGPPAGQQPQMQLQQPPPPVRKLQQLHQQPPQHQHQQRSAPPPQPPKLQFRVNASDAYVILSHKKIDIVKVGPAGDVILDSSGDRSAEMLTAFNAALAPIKITVKAPGPDPETWSVSDGRGLLRFADGMKIPAKGHLTAGRAMVLMQAFAAGSSKAAAAAAQEASRQAAIAAGILPATAAAAAAGDAAVEAPEESAEAARIRRLKAQGRYQPY